MRAELWIQIRIHFTSWIWIGSRSGKFEEKNKTQNARKMVVFAVFRIGSGWIRVFLPIRIRILKTLILLFLFLIF